MDITAGIFLQSTSGNEDELFGNALIFVAEHNTSGAVGFVVNKPFGRALNELQEFRSSPSFPLYFGGPVDTEHLFFIHRRPDLIGGGTRITGDIYFGGDFLQVVAAIGNNSIATNELKVFAGYCGWNAGDLETELDNGDWLPGDGDAFFTHQDV